MKCVNVNFEVSSENALQYGASKDYVFKCDIDVQEGDLVVCETARGYGVGKVVGEEVRESRRKIASAWIVSKIDLTAHKARLEKEKRMAEIKSKMLERKKSLDEDAMFRLLAKDDTAMADLLKEYDELKG